MDGKYVAIDDLARFCFLGKRLGAKLARLCRVERVQDLPPSRLQPMEQDAHGERSA
jgi:hypothetical protein